MPRATEVRIRGWLFLTPLHWRSRVVEVGLLTGDAPLRALAEAEQVECHGVLWLIDRMDAELVAEPAVLRAGLDRLARHPRCRLPRAEIDARLARLGDAMTGGD